jgi:glucose/arabinose dehydrogenase
MAQVLVLPLLVIALAPAPARADRAAAPVDSPLAVQLVPIATNVDSPLGINNAGDGSGRVFITLQGGQIIIWDGTQVLPTPFLDIDPIVQSGGEQGLLGLAFHPDYKNNGYFYVNYSDTTGGDTVIARYKVSASDPNVADPTSALILLEIDQPFSNHNGGQLQFGPDGYLYIGMGDGGSGGDPGDRAQDMTELLGKMLRIDVNNVVGGPPDCGRGSNYTIPADNPFVDGPGGDCDEIFQVGLRNPWRFSFDRLTGDLFIGDVGQDLWEEVDYAPAGSTAGRNWGWRCYEGNHPFNLAGCGPESDYDFPILEYSHSLGCSVTGGYVYRGTAFPAAQGTYVFSDTCSGVVWGARQVGGGLVVKKIKDTPYSIVTFGETEEGELCFSHHDPSGTVFCVVPSP